MIDNLYIRRIVTSKKSNYSEFRRNYFLSCQIELGNKFDPCFKGTTPIPCNRINLKRQAPSFIEISTAETGSIQLEFRDLSRSSNDSKYEVSDSEMFTDVITSTGYLFER